MAVRSVARPSRRDTPASRPDGAPRRRHDWTGLLFVLPFLVFFVAFLVWPLLAGLGTATTSAGLSTSGEFVGLDNFIDALRDPDVWTSLGNTLWFTLLSTPILVLVGLVLALLVHQLTPARWFWRLSFFAPFLLPSSVVALIFVWIFQPDFGMADGMLAAIGLNPGIGWLSDPSMAMFSIVLTTTWWTVGFNFLLYLAALQSIPQHFYEAAAIDGAGDWRRLWSITLPLLGRTTGLVVVLQLLASLKVFDQIYLMTSGGPGTSTIPVIQYVYEIGFTNFRVGYASAISYLFFALVLVIALVQLRLFGNRKESDR
ncbi:multiple sugar transport system permease protein [Actinoalloteichus hoggarensis]|uniref:Lactose transport system permease protein LacF n=1 Tax=Actinoalloteichus hoggarensis TaxID=1470176 RepID=A0A221VXX2_9PSEU|nr:sugar ABC transporter permease [Actinoalloteichus hoggarensis]ASO18400.1 Lactose transport system permease protein LacF [Actinoalloteichus hoggarensis]MBB5921764.1 multiple sugar transport system permease protein [Actinoalloteichus hoggarensis]